jgi:GMP synthase - Glutamine amidotransferase domain
MDRDALVIHHVAFEDLGVMEPLLAARGYRVRDLRAGVDPLDPDRVAGAELLVVLGGPIGVGDQQRYPFLTRELDAVAARLDRGGPTLGICLGAQLVAAALGAEVAPSGRVEIGYGPLTLTRAGRDSVLAELGDTPVLHWHGDQFAIPSGAKRLAATPGFPNQAFSRGAEVLALQFHLEADHTRIEQWLIGHAHELASRGIDPQVLRDEARRHGPDLSLRAQAVLGSWLDALPS